MKRKRRSDSFAWTPFQRAVLKPEYVERYHKLGVQPKDTIYLNSRYQVAVTELVSEDGQQSVTHLSIKRRDKTPIRDWRELQRIKNELCGHDREGFEVFPAEARLTDTANQYDLWVLPAGKSISVGWSERIVTEGDSSCGSRQRDFEDQPFDLLPVQHLDLLEEKMATTQVSPEEKRVASALSRISVDLNFGAATTTELEWVQEALATLLAQRKEQP
jgi:hypothetical protein